MIKWLLTLGIVVLALMWWFGKGRGGGAARDGRPAGKPRPKQAQPMVACAHCGLHLPAADAIEGEGGRSFCSAEHRRLGPTS
ncbi:PP0621 family protein [Ideonella lacteola]|uniref:PP0621 family protein n=1 Tax=Ideonella lacteola TaxID=2984193 RepID=UPI003BF96446